MADAYSLYPAPPQPQQNSLSVVSNPANAIQLLTGINALTKSTQDIRARNAVGEIYRKNIRPNGTLDERGAIRDIANNPDTAWSAPEAVGGMLQRQGQALDNAGKSIINNTAMLDQRGKMQDFLTNSFSMIDPDKPTTEQVLNWAVMMKRNFPNIPSPLINGIAQHALSDPQGLAHGVASMKNMALGAGGTSERVQGPPGPSGAPTTITKGQANLNGAGGGITTGLPPGEDIVMGGAANRAERLQATASTSQQYHADLDNLKQDSRVLENLGGPTFEVEKKLNQLTTRLGGFGVTMTPEQLKAGESFDKIANQISTSQAGNLGAATDAGRHMVVGANPSTSMSAYGREGVIDMLQGNQDAIDLTRKLWMDAKGKGVPANTYDNFVHNLSQTLDPRVFQFARMSRDNQQKFLHNMDPADVSDFEQKYKTAIEKKWVKPLKKASE